MKKFACSPIWVEDSCRMVRVCNLLTSPPIEGQFSAKVEDTFPQPPVPPPRPQAFFFSGGGGELCCCFFSVEKGKGRDLFGVQ